MAGECATGVLIELCDEPEPLFTDFLQQKVINGNWWAEEIAKENGELPQDEILVDISDGNEKYQNVSVCEDLGSDSYFADTSLLNSGSLLEDEVFDFECAKSLTSESDEERKVKTGTKEVPKGHNTTELKPTVWGPKEMAEVFREATVLAVKFTSIGQKRRSVQMSPLKPSGEETDGFISTQMDVDRIFGTDEKPDDLKENSKDVTNKRVEQTENTVKGPVRVLRKETFRVEKSKMKGPYEPVMGPKQSLTKNVGKPNVRSERKSLLSSNKTDSSQRTSLQRSNSHSTLKGATAKGPSVSRIPTSPSSLHPLRRSSSGSSVSSVNSSCSTDVSSKEGVVAGTGLAPRRLLNSIFPGNLKQSLALNRKKSGLNENKVAVPMRATLHLKPPSTTTPSRATKKCASEAGNSSSPQVKVAPSVVTPKMSGRRFSFGSGTLASRLKSTPSKLK